MERKYNNKNWASFPWKNGDRGRRSLLKLRVVSQKKKNINKAHDARFKRQGDEALPG